MKTILNHDHIGPKYILHAYIFADINFIDKSRLKLLLFTIFSSSKVYLANCIDLLT